MPKPEISRRRENLAVIPADQVLHELVAVSDIIDIGGRKFMVAPLTDKRIEALVVAMAATEDAEPNVDDEPSLGDTASYGIDDAEGPDADTEDELGWANTGPQLSLRGGLEGDGNCDAEPDHDEEPSGDEGDYLPYSLEPVDHDIRLMLRDSIMRKRAGRRR